MSTHPKDPVSMAKCCLSSALQMDKTIKVWFSKYALAVNYTQSQKKRTVSSLTSPVTQGKGQVPPAGLYLIKINEARWDYFFDHNATLWGHFFCTCPQLSTVRFFWDWVYLCLWPRHQPSRWFSFTTHFHETTKALLQNIFPTWNSFPWDPRFSFNIMTAYNCFRGDVKSDSYIEGEGITTKDHNFWWKIEGSV